MSLSLRRLFTGRELRPQRILLRLKVLVLLVELVVQVALGGEVVAHHAAHGTLKAQGNPLVAEGSSTRGSAVAGALRRLVAIGAFAGPTRARLMIRPSGLRGTPRQSWFGFRCGSLEYGFFFWGELVLLAALLQLPAVRKEIKRSSYLAVYP